MRFQISPVRKVELHPRRERHTHPVRKTVIFPQLALVELHDTARLFQTFDSICAYDRCGQYRFENTYLQVQ